MSMPAIGCARVKSNPSLFCELRGVWRSRHSVNRSDSTRALAGRGSSYEAISRSRLGRSPVRPSLFARFRQTRLGQAGVGWVERSDDPTPLCTLLCVGSSLTLDPTYAL